MELNKEQLYEKFRQWANQYPAHHPQWKPRTTETYITDARRILLTDECLPGGGYPAVWNYITQIAPQAKSQFGDWVESRFRDKKSGCP